MPQTPNAAKGMSIIVAKGSLGRAYPPFILVTTAAAMKMSMMGMHMAMPNIVAARPRSTPRRQPR